MSKSLMGEEQLEDVRAKLKALVQRIAAGKGETITDSELCEIFEPFFQQIPQFDATKYEGQISLACGYIPSHAEIYLLRRWNTLMQDRQLDAEVLLKPYKDWLVDGVNRLLERVRSTRHLHSIFDDSWIQGAKQEIAQYSGEEPFKTDKHAVLIGFLHEEGSGRDFLETLDECFGAIKHIIGTQRIRRLENQLRDLSRPLDQYWGTVFSTIVVGRCAQHGLLKSPQDYEAVVGNNRAEALITVGENRILLEATVCVTGRELISGRAIEDLGALADKIKGKVLDKAQQLHGATDPILLFLHPHHSITGIEIQQGLERAFGECGVRGIGGVVVARNTALDGWEFGYVKNNDAASKQLPEAAFPTLANIFKFKELRLEAHPVEWAKWQ